MGELVYFFGYGANSNPLRIQAILGEVPNKYGAILKGQNIFLQDVDQIPEPAKTILAEVWGEYFRSYTIRPGDGIVVGNLWLLTDEQLAKIKAWETVDNWREVITVRVILSTGEEVSAYTDRALLNQKVLPNEIDGIEYIQKLETLSAPPPDPETAQRDQESRIRQIEEIRKRIAQISGHEAAEDITEHFSMKKNNPKQLTPNPDYDDDDI